MDEFVTKAVHDEFAKRIDEENDRQNHRLSILETGQAQINELVSSVKVLAIVLLVYSFRKFIMHCLRNKIIHR